MHSNPAEAFRRLMDGDEPRLKIDDGIWIVQLVCMNRHGIAVTGFDGATTTAEETMFRIRRAVVRQVEAGRLSPNCEICLSRDWHFEVTRTTFHSLADAGAELERIERAEAARSAPRRSYKERGHHRG